LAKLLPTFKKMLSMWIVCMSFYTL